MNKKMYFLLFSFLLMLPFVFPVINVNAEAIEGVTLEEASKVLTAEDEKLYKSMTDEEKNEREISIAENYDEGSILSEEDTIFLLNQAKNLKNNSGIELRAGSSSKAVSKTLSKFGTKVTLKGTMYQNIAYVAGTSTFRGNLTLTRNSGSLKKVSLATHHSAYGIIGWSGKYPTVGRVYKGSVSMSKTSNLNSTKMDKTKKYSSVLPSYTTMYSQATVTTSKGDQYTVTSPSWSRAQ
ncbi:hypothetical protein MUB24_12485 [Lederbergia sp. NSJ-179]|uniref:hypothetical protein n=1 Tax=Lederbergia sp. NSJ-179 TaxID=2931402 RepID=UPI001FD57C8C|nr:hypothetical protein [Lederbergia sp. NSJ-179]MCJ7841698.1 hypothetical protein [Lederbergia sp. NSJ-179]